MYRGIRSKSSARENVDLLLNGVVVTKDTEKTCVFFTYVFTDKIWFHKSQTLENTGSIWSNEDSSWVEKIRTFKEIGHKQVPEMWQAASRSTKDRCHGETTLKYPWKATVIREVSWGLEESKCHDSHQQEKNEDVGNYKPVSITSIPGKVMEQIIPQTSSKYIKDLKMIGRQQCWFMKGKPCLTDLIAFCDEMISLVDKQRAVDANHVDLAGLSAPAAITSSLTNWWLDKWTGR